MQLSRIFNKEQKMEELAEEIEQELDLVGATGIEDKLQEGVPETIEKLLQSKIRVWVLTGDKQEIAIEIAKSCNLITPSTTLIDLSCNTKQQFESKLNA